MADISAQAVKELREKTGLPLMECKRALTETGGDQEAAIRKLREQGIKTEESRIGRETPAGRIAVYTDFDQKVGAMVELKCESAPVANSEVVKTFANDLAKQLATGPGAKTADELLAQPCPSQPGKTLKDVKDDLFARIREVFNVGRMVRFDGPVGGYAHHTGAVGVLLAVDGGSPEAAKDVSMHVAAMRPLVVATGDLDPAAVQTEREILTAAAKTEGKPENIIAKMVEGRMKNYYAEKVLAEQPFVKDDKQTVGQYAKSAGMKLVRFEHWDLGA